MHYLRTCKGNVRDIGAYKLVKQKQRNLLGATLQTPQGQRLSLSLSQPSPEITCKNGIFVSVRKRWQLKCLCWKNATITWCWDRCKFAQQCWCCPSFSAWDRWPQLKVPYKICFFKSKGKAATCRQSIVLVGKLFLSHSINALGQFAQRSWNPIFPLLFMNLSDNIRMVWTKKISEWKRWILKDPRFHGVVSLNMQRHSINI